MTKILFDYDDASGTCCTVTGAAAGTLLITRTRGEHTLENIPLDAYQAALLIPELERFISQRSPHRVGDLTWRVTDGELYLNDVPIVDTRFTTRTEDLGVYSTVSRMITRGANSELFEGLPFYKSDVQMEQWIVTRLAELARECEF